MPKTSPFDAHPDHYDDWFDRHEAAYQSELRAIRTVLPDTGDGLEVGVGTGRFAAPLGIECGVDPSAEMRRRARERGIPVKDGAAEKLPYPDAQFDIVLMTSTLCYLDNPQTAFAEARRVLPPRRCTCSWVHRPRRAARTPVRGAKGRERLLRVRPLSPGKRGHPTSRRSWF